MQDARIDTFSGDYRFLSNFHPCVVTLDGDTYPTVEHAYQAAKTLDPELRCSIAALATPGKAKRFMLTRQLRDDWPAVRLPTMSELLRQKFASEPLRSMLLDTAPAELIEGNTWGDTFWGVCDGVGDNHLGRLLMALRTAIATEGDRRL